MLISVFAPGLIYSKNTCFHALRQQDLLIIVVSSIQTLLACFMDIFPRNDGSLGEKMVGSLASIFAYSLIR